MKDPQLYCVFSTVDTRFIHDSVYHDVHVLQFQQ